MGTVVSPRVLTRGIDTLYWSTACGIADERFAAFRAARERAADGARSSSSAGTRWYWNRTARAVTRFF